MTHGSEHMRSSNSTSRRPHRRKASATSERPVARHRPPASLLIVVAILVMLGTAMGQTSRGATASPPGEASPDLIAEARKHFRLGLQLYNEGNGRAALIEMRRAYEIAPSPRLLYNIGQAASDAKDYAAAFDAMSLYLERGGTDLNEQRREQVEKISSRYAAAWGSSESKPMSPIPKCWSTVSKSTSPNDCW